MATKTPPATRQREKRQQEKRQATAKQPPPPQHPMTLDPLDDKDRRLVDAVERALVSGLELQDWWRGVDAADAYEERFDLSRTQNRPDVSFGFFGEATVTGKPMAVMGNVQEMFYDRPKTPTLTEPNPEDAAPPPRGKKKGPLTAAELTLANYPEWMRSQVREFVLRYFMRVSSFQQPESYPGYESHDTPGYLRPFSWCPSSDAARVGFGFQQVYAKRTDDGDVGKFPEGDRHAIVDLRELGKSYDWIVARVNIFDFRFTAKLAGPGGPELSLPLSEASYVVLSRGFILNDDHPESGELGHYGLGYAFVRDPDEESVLAYGPGQFEAAFQVIHFLVREAGTVDVRMAFVANRPTKVVDISLDPFDWGSRLARLLPADAGSRLLEPLKQAFSFVPRPQGVDVVSGYISLVNALTGGMAARDLCISKRQLERDFLLQHFTQHYNTLAGSLVTWRQIPDWLDESRLPDWVLHGK